MVAMAAAGNGTNYLVDLLPVSKYVPSWFPGAKFERDVKGWRKDVLATPEAPFELVKVILFLNFSNLFITATIRRTK